jgi:hypothetical protein
MHSGSEVRSPVYNGYVEIPPVALKELRGREKVAYVT